MVVNMQLKKLRHKRRLGSTVAVEHSMGVHEVSQICLSTNIECLHSSKGGAQNDPRRPTALNMPV